MVCREVDLVVGHIFKADWETFPLSPVSVPLVLYLSIHLTII